MGEVRLSGGVITYEVGGGDGPVVVLLHGVAMDGSLWRHVVAGLGGGVRCIVPTLPLGGHRRPMEPDADLTVLGVARLVAEFLEALRLDDVTLVMMDGWFLPQGRLVEVADSYTLLPEDRPDALVEHITAFLAEAAA
ncbi:Oxidoreductase [Streptomyces sp. CBMAI 2042]|nr:Oxidoreductase [Streptomyces sp. CBMAI 2042]